MLLFWKIRYFDRSDREFKDRSLYLLTESLDSVSRAAVELIAESQSHRRDRDILPFRGLFTEQCPKSDDVDMRAIGRFECVGPDEYVEDETGREIPHREMGPLLTGSPTAVLIPHGAKPHDIQLMLSERTPLPVAEVALSSEEIRVLGIFVQDLQEMLDSAFRRDGPGKLKTIGGFALSPGSCPTLETAFTADEGASFVNVFRRLYMVNEQANFLKAVDVFVKAIGNHPYGRWTIGVAREYQGKLAAAPDAIPFLPEGTCSFSAKRLIDVFLYTQYVHQPDERRQRQFGECLSEVHGHRSVLTWLFFTTTWGISLTLGRAGRVIGGWFSRYCEHHGVTPDVPTPLRKDHAGLGAAEKVADQRTRLLREKTEALALESWQRNGKPEGGPAQFVATAREQLMRRLQA